MLLQTEDQPPHINVELLHLATELSMLQATEVVLHRPETTVLLQLQVIVAVVVILPILHRADLLGRLQWVHLPDRADRLHPAPEEVRAEVVFEIIK